MSPCTQRLSRRIKLKNQWKNRTLYRGRSRIFLRRGAPLRNDVTDCEVKNFKSEYVDIKTKALSKGGVCTPCTPQIRPCSSVSDKRLRFPRKSISLQQIFDLTQCSSIHDNHVIMGKDPKDKGKGKTKRISETLRIFRRCQACRRRLARPRAFVAFGKVFFLCLIKWSFLFVLWAGFLRFLYPRTFFCF